MTTKYNSPPLSFKEKVGYGMGDMASNFYMGFFSLFLLYYYTDVYGISAAAAATMLLVTKIIDAVSDPAMGLIADRTTTKWGKYRPYLLWMAIPYALLGYLLFLGPEFGDTGKLIFAYITYSLIMLAYTAINVPYSGLMAVIHPQSGERTKAAQFRFIFASVGSLVVGASAKPLVDYLGGGDELLGFRLTIILFAILSVAVFWYTFAVTKERVTPKKHESSIKEDFATLLENKSWIILVFTGIFVVVGLVARFASIAYYTKYYMGDDGTNIFLWMDETTLIISCGLLGQLFGALITPKLVTLFEKHKLMFAINLIHALLLFFAFTISPDNLALTIIVHTLGIITFGIAITLLFTMYTDCVEYGEWKTGNNSAGLTVSASMFSLKFGSAVGGALPGFILAAFGFIANETQTPESIEGIRYMFNILPGVFFLFGAILILFYKIDRAQLTQIENDLAQRRN
ncbi:MFS transporter [Pseudocolwellia agarivorans]|uniref:MFS transporter n=1 Tax=Pseudocolwellia agarivorans TaxID=1911682 RepID=UPI00098430CE|nr:MFS transporter [Pseudocolwellia agarivorans]